jgi:hypothetical protein
MIFFFFEWVETSLQNLFGIRKHHDLELRSIFFGKPVEISFAQIVVAVNLTEPGTNKRIHTTLVATDVEMHYRTGFFVDKTFFFYHFLPGTYGIGTSGVSTLELCLPSRLPPCASRW